MALAPWFTHNLTVLIGFFALGLGGAVRGQARCRRDRPARAARPELLAFGVSYGYRMLPILVDEYVAVFEGQRLRHAPPARRGLLGWRVLWQWCVMAVTAFYPIVLNTAKNVRTTAEALETRGFTYGASNSTGRTLRLAYLRVTGLDVAVLAATALTVIGAYWMGAQFPLRR